MVAALVPAALSFVVAILNFGSQFMPGISGPTSSPASLVGFFGTSLIVLALSAAAGVVQAIALGGLVRMALMTLRGEPISAGDVFRLDGQGFNIFLVSFLVNLVVGAAIFITICFLGLPGLLVNGLLLLSMPFVVAERLGPAEAMQASWAALKPQLWAAAGISLILGLVVAVLSMTGVGAIIGYPILAISLAIIYRDQVALPRQQSSAGR